MRCARVADRPWRGGRGDARGPRGDVRDGKDAGVQEEALEHPGGTQAEGKDFQWMGGWMRGRQQNGRLAAGGRPPGCRERSVCRCVGLACSHGGMDGGALVYPMREGGDLTGEGRRAE